MRLCLITNPGSGSAEQGAVLRDHAAEVGGEVWETQQEGDAAAFVQRAAAEGFDLVAACGGDGTVNEVVNGLMALDAAVRPAFGIVPLGTGNDFARTLALPTDPLEAMRLLSTGARVRLDAFRLTSSRTDRYGVNMAAGGFSGLVNEEMDEDLKKRWGPIAYLIGAAKALPDLEPFRLALYLDAETPEAAPHSVIDAYNVFVANGRYVAGGKSVAPYADPADGWLDVVVVRASNAADMARLAGALLSDAHHDDVLLAQFRARRVVVESTPCMLFNVDGELVAQEPLALDVVPAALDTVVGPGYVAQERPLPAHSMVQTVFGVDTSTLPGPPGAA